MLGFFGSIAASHTANKNAERLVAELEAAGFDLRGRFGEALMQELASGPLLPSVATDDERSAKARKADDFRILGLDTDAVLDISVSSYGFYSSSGMDDYTAQIYVDMGLRSPRTSEWMGNASYAYDRSPSNGYQRHFQTAAEHKFSSIDALLAERPRVVAALDTGIGKIAGAIAVDVKTVLEGRFLE